MKRDFWPNSSVAVLGGGSWGSVLAQLASKNVKEVRLWVRSEEHAREINSTRSNSRYFESIEMNSKITAMSDLGRVFESQVHAVIWALPSAVARETAKKICGCFKGDEILIHATKGVEPQTLKRISSVLKEEIPCARLGVISGPNLAVEISEGKSASTIVASKFLEVIEAGKAIFQSPEFLVFGSFDVIGVEWAGTLKNVLAIAAGAVETANLGWNARSILISNGLNEMLRFGKALGASEETFLGLAGIGDLLATCTPLSRNYRVGMGLGRGEPIDAILRKLGSTAEGVATARNVSQFARDRKIDMPITQSVDQLIHQKIQVLDIFQ